jgi:short-subunit dehydrogenase
MLLEGKRVVLTGATGGIGRLLARELLVEGAELATLDRGEAGVPGTASLRGDLSSIAGIEAAGILAADFRPDILINLAGVQYFGPFESQDVADLERTYLVDLIAPILLAKSVLPGMKALKAGQIVNIGSIFGSISYAHFVTYSSAKAGLRAFSEALRRELAGSPIAVTYIAPRAVRTGLSRDRVLEFAEASKMGMDDPQRVARQIIHAIAARRKDVYLGFPESLFVRLNALMPRVIDAALAGNDRKAAALFSQ